MKFFASLVEVLMKMVIFFRVCHFLPILHLKKPKCSTLLTRNRKNNRAVLPGMGGSPVLLSQEWTLPWAVAAADSVDAALEVSLEVSLEAYPLDAGDIWNPDWDPEDIADLAGVVPAHPNIWTDGGRDEALDVSSGVAFAGVFVKNAPWVFDGRSWGHAEDLYLVDDVCRIGSVPGWLRRFSGLNIVVLSWPCRLSCPYTLVSITKMSVTMLVGHSMIGAVTLLCGCAVDSGQFALGQRVYSS